MKILILNGSPRIRGNTNILLTPFKEALREASVEFSEVRAYDTDVASCTDCRVCRNIPGCVISDDMQTIYESVRECDGIVLASPVYTATLTPPLLAIGSRMQTFFSAKRFRGEEPFEGGKRGAIFLTGGGSGSADGALCSANLLLREMGCSKIAPPVLSLATDVLPAAEDPVALEKAKKVAAFFLWL